MTATTQPHILIVTGTPTDDDLSYTVECPGVTDACRAWRECTTCPRPLPADAEDALWDDREAHGVEHQHLDATWMVPTGECFLATAEDMWDAGRALGLPAGRWPVDFTVEDDIWLHLAVRAGVS
jgi:hypothetical protein